VCEEQMTVSALEFIKRGSKMVIGTTFDKPVNLSSCINCGQCTIACPTGALYEKDHLAAVYEALHNPHSHVVIQYSPTISVTLAEEYDLKPGKDINGILNGILHKIGFDKVFETAFGVDLAIHELAAELLERVESGNKFPMLSGDCPAWVKYLEQVYPQLLPMLTTCKSPQQMTGAISKSFYAESRQIDPEKIVMVSAVPCTAKKFEAQREEMIQKGIADVDIVITTRELLRMIRLQGINLQQIEPENADLPMSSRSSAAKFAGVVGGETEALYRILHFMITGKEAEFFKLPEARNVKGRKEFKVEIGPHEFSFCIVNGLKYAKQVLDEVAGGRKDLDFIEVMACQGGCINGGGQTVITDKSFIKNRARALYEFDEKESVKSAHRNPGVADLYRNYLEKPLGERCMALLHTSYKERDVLL
ncbi:MAG: [Fe-Fe] hydrogenase large subunit C-terminal domain-containing protein, partial [Bacteroidota bacterium]|nr:[Fe-Fe] hydrogenase large subunit C-terminal domain-containing protein [Bacteroidota bacterium]